MSTILGLFTGNIKFIMYFLIASIVASAAWTLYSTIKENGMYEAKIAILEHNAQVKDNQIASLREAFKLANELVTDRDRELRELEEKMKGNTDNLGADAEDQAADSLKEYFKRLSK